MSRHAMSCRVMHSNSITHARERKSEVYAFVYLICYMNGYCSTRVYRNECCLCMHVCVMDFFVVVYLITHCEDIRVPSERARGRMEGGKLFDNGESKN